MFFVFVFFVFFAYDTRTILCKTHSSTNIFLYHAQAIQFYNIVGHIDPKMAYNCGLPPWFGTFRCLTIFPLHVCWIYITLQSDIFGFPKWKKKMCRRGLVDYEYLRIIAVSHRQTCMTCKFPPQPFPLKEEPYLPVMHFLTNSWKIPLKSFIWFIFLSRSVWTWFL